MLSILSHESSLLHEQLAPAEPEYVPATQSVHSEAPASINKQSSSPFAHPLSSFISSKKVWE